MKKIFFLSCLLIPAGTHCMEAEELNLSKVSVAERQNLVRKHCSNTNNIQFPYFQENHHLVLKNQQKIKELHSHGYSALGFAAIAIQVYTNPMQFFTVTESKKVIFDSAPYNTKKELIQTLRQNYGFEPTKKDRELALQIEREETIRLLKENISTLKAEIKIIKHKTEAIILNEKIDLLEEKIDLINNTEEHSFSNNKSDLLD